MFFYFSLGAFGQVTHSYHIGSSFNYAPIFNNNSGIGGGIHLEYRLIDRFFMKSQYTFFFEEENVARGKVINRSGILQISTGIVLNENRDSSKWRFPILISAGQVISKNKELEDYFKGNTFSGIGFGAHYMITPKVSTFLETKYHFNTPKKDLTKYLQISIGIQYELGSK